MTNLRNKLKDINIYTFSNNLGNKLHETVSREMSRSSVSNVMQLDRFIDDNIHISIFYSVRKIF